MEKRFFSVREAALYSGLSSRLLYQKLKERELRHYKVNSKILIEKKDLDSLIIQGAVMTSDEIRKKIREKRR